MDGEQKRNGKMVKINSRRKAENFLFIQNILHNLGNCFFSPFLRSPLKEISIRFSHQLMVIAFNISSYFGFVDVAGA